jgi:hypothetical protein
VLAHIAVHTVSAHQVGYSELAESARSHGAFPSISLAPGRDVPALCVFITACLKFFHFETRHSSIPQDNKSAYLSVR